jgi:hypothetical protein
MTSREIIDIDGEEYEMNRLSAAESSRQTDPPLRAIQQRGQLLDRHQHDPPRSLAEPRHDARLRSDIAMMRNQRYQQSLETAPSWLVDVEFPSHRVRAAQLEQLQAPLYMGGPDNLLSLHLAREERLAQLQAHRDIAAAAQSHRLPHPSQLRLAREGSSPLGYSYDGDFMHFRSALEEMGTLAPIQLQHLLDQGHVSSVSHRSAGLPPAAAAMQQPPHFIPRGLSALLSNHDFGLQRDIMLANLGAAQYAARAASPMLRQQLLMGGASSSPNASTHDAKEDTLKDVPRDARRPPRHAPPPCRGADGPVPTAASPSRQRRCQQHVRNGSFPCVLYLGEVDDEGLTPYQCCLRKHLELFEADEDDVRNSTRQGRTAPVKLGQVGLRCRHCADAKVAARTKGAAYYSQSVEGLYQIAQNMSKVHLMEKCKHMPSADRRHLIALRNDSRRANGGKEYWKLKIREMGVYEDPPILRARG